MKYEMYHVVNILCRDNKVMATCTLGSDPVAAVIAELMYQDHLPAADQIK